MIPNEDNEDSFTMSFSGICTKTGIQITGDDIDTLKVEYSKALFNLYDDMVEDLIDSIPVSKLSAPKKYLFDNGTMYSVEASVDMYLDKEEQQLESLND